MKSYSLNEVEYKSIDELYFAYYLEELKNHGYIRDYKYEYHTYVLAGSKSLRYTKQLKTKTKEMREAILKPVTLTSDFTIEWAWKAKGIFFLDANKPIEDVKSIPFRLSIHPNNLVSEIEVKPYNEINTSSSISFPVKQKWVYAQHGEYIQKIIPYNPKNEKCLFSLTFYPEAVIEDLKYKVNSKFGKKGESKIKGNYRTILEYLDDIK